VSGEVLWCYAQDGKIEEGGTDAIEETLSQEQMPDLNKYINIIGQQKNKS
jgi:hypothetical protein